MKTNMLCTPLLSCHHSEHLFLLMQREQHCLCQNFPQNDDVDDATKNAAGTPTPTLAIAMGGGIASFLTSKTS